MCWSAVHAESERPHSATAAPIDGSSPSLLRPIRLLILLFAITLTLVLALERPLQGLALRPAKRARAHQTNHMKLGLEPTRRRHLMFFPPGDPTRLFGHQVVAYARHFLGVPYSWGGTSPHTGFDCSGLVRYVYGHFGIPLPHSSYGDLMRGHRVLRRRLRQGDLVFFYGAGHVGIYVGSGRFIDAPHTGSRVRISAMSQYGSVYAARRLAHRG